MHFCICFIRREFQRQNGSRKAHTLLLVLVVKLLSQKAVVLLSYCNKLSQTFWLKTTQIHRPVQEVRSPKIKVPARLHSSGSSRENPFLCLFQLLEAVCICWLIGSFLHLQSQQAEQHLKLSLPVTCDSVVICLLLSHHFL